jgi:hypothetical protein
MAMLSWNTWHSLVNFIIKPVIKRSHCSMFIIVGCVAAVTSGHHARQTFKKIHACEAFADGRRRDGLN